MSKFKRGDRVHLNHKGLGALQSLARTNQTRFEVQTVDPRDGWVCVKLSSGFGQWIDPEYLDLEIPEYE